MSQTLQQVLPVQKGFDPYSVRGDFPLLQITAHGKPLVYLDNAATTQKPRVVIQTLRHYYEAQNANIHRGVYALSQQATDAYEQARRKVQRFINAPSARQIVFTRGSTESINLVANCYGRMTLREGDEVVISTMEHHSNIVSWQMICQQTGARLRVIEMTDTGELRMDHYRSLLNERTRIVAVTAVSNALGTINDVDEITALAHQAGAKVLIDAAQWVAHAPTDVQAMDCDFLVFSGHKIFGPTGIGVLYGKLDLLEAMPPWQGGGDMIETVRFEQTTYASTPNKYEAGTPHIAGAIGLGAAIDYVAALDLKAVAEYERQLLAYATEKLSTIPGLRLIGTAPHKAGVISFVMEEPAISAYELGIALDMMGIAIRTGHHCCMPLMDRLGINGTARASLAMYNTREEIDALVAGLQKLAGSLKPKPTAPPVQDAQQLIWPEPVASSPQEAADELIEAFELLGDWEARDQYLLELGEKIPPMPDWLKTESNRVHGCMSTVHLHARKRPGTVDAIDFLADSDAHLVRGLIAVLQRLFSGQSASAILKFDTEKFFSQLGLDRHLSMGRRNGLAGMVKRIGQEAARLGKAS